MKSYRAIKLHIPEEHQDTFVALISDLEFTGIEQLNDEITINFLANYYDEEIKVELLESAGIMGVETKIVSDNQISEKNWNEDWEKTLEPVIISNELVISPTSKADNFLDYKFVIKINPQMSFGTGYHVTTRLASILLMKTVNSKEKWLDAGTGTGVLAILASKLGASSVEAFDIDEWSVTNTKENIDLNCVNNITVLKSDLNSLQLDRFDGIVANIFANILINNMSKFSDSIINNGYLICTGILKYDKLKVLEAAELNGFELLTELDEDEWVAYKFRKNK